MVPSTTENLPTTDESTEDHQWPQYLATIVACISALIIGNVVGWSSPAQMLIMPPMHGNLTNYISEYNFDMSEEEFSWIVSSIGLGGGFCSLFMVGIQNRIGRRNTLLLIAIPFIIGWAMVTGAQNFPTLLIGRLFAGAASGAVSVTITTYISEISDKRIRGRLSSFSNLASAIGILMVYALGAGNNLIAINVVCLIIPLIFVVMFVFMPQSPYYLVFKGRYADAIIALKWLHGRKFNTTNEMSKMVYEDRIHQLDTNSKWKELLSRSTIRANVIALGLIFFQQWSGVVAVTFYTSHIFQEADSPLAPILSSIVVAALQLIGTIVASLIIDKFGRRILLIFSIIVMLICTVLLAEFFYLVQIRSSHVEYLHWLPICTICLFIMAFSLGFGLVPSIMVGEIFKLDGFGASLSISFQWFLSFVVGKIYPELTFAIGIGETFWLFSGFSFIGIFFVLFLVPETKGKSLGEIQEMLESGGFFVKPC